METQMNSNMSPAPVNSSHVGLIAGAIALLVVGGIVGYVMGIGRSSSITETPIPSASTSADPVVGWQMYRNEKYGFEFKYPTSAKISEESRIASGIYKAGILVTATMQNGSRFVVSINPMDHGLCEGSSNDIHGSRTIDGTTKTYIGCTSGDMILEDYKFKKNGNDVEVLLDYSFDEMSLVNILSTFKIF